MARGAHTRKGTQSTRGRGRVAVQPHQSTGLASTGKKTPTSTCQLSTNTEQLTPSVQRTPSPICTPFPYPNSTPSVKVNHPQNSSPTHEGNNHEAANHETLERNNEDMQESHGTNQSDQAVESSVTNQAGLGNSKWGNVCHVSEDRKNLCPTGPVSRAIIDTFHRMWFSEEHTWKSLLPNQVEFYWQEFKKKFTFFELEHVVRASWLTHAGTRYTDNLSKFRTNFEKNGVTESHIKKDIWDEWMKKWDTPEYRVKRQKMSSNRRTEKAGLGTGMSRHTGGSKSMIDRHLKMTDADPTKPNLHELFLQTHTKKGKPSEFVYERSRQFEERYQTIYAEKAREMGEGVDPHQCMVHSFVEAAQGFDAHYRLYGAGSLSKEFKAGANVFPSASASSQVNLGEIDAVAAATIDALQSQVKMLVADNNARKNSEEELTAQLSQLKYLVQSLISGSNGASGSELVCAVSGNDNAMEMNDLDKGSGDDM